MNRVTARRAAETPPPPEQPPNPAVAALPPEQPSSPAVAALPPEREPQPMFSDTSDPGLYSLPATGRRPVVDRWSSLVPAPLREASSPAAPPGYLCEALVNEKAIDISMVQRGIKLTVKNIDFAADSDWFPRSEYPRLDALASALTLAPRDRMILVDGYTDTADNPVMEMDRSFLRARRMVEALKSRGIDEGRLIFRAWGSAQPLADNTADEGRRLNRRVEITILNEGERLP
jgi:outer membrane protein OmpA-like peptidoglycan-associated protein